MRLGIMKKFVVSLAVISVFAGASSFAGTITGTVATKKIKTPENILVFIEKVEGKEFPPPKEMSVMNQIDLMFIPRVIPVVKGTTVGFKNADSVLHNVFGVGDAYFDLGTWKGERVRTYVFNELGEVAILCNVHPEMEAYIVVLQNPYFALTNAEGKYVIKDVPPGEYELKTWHDRLKEATKKIKVTGSSATAADFRI